MTLAKESSVAFSVRQLLDAETERLEAETVAREAQLAQRREQERMARQAERLEQQEPTERAQAEERRLQSLHEADRLKVRLQAESESALARMHSEQMHEARRLELQRDDRVTRLLGRQRVLLAALVTLVTGVTVCWFTVVEPDRGRASQAYVQLHQSYDGMLSDAREREATLRRERTQLKEKLDSALRQLALVPPTDSGAKPGPAPVKPLPIRLPASGSQPCRCLRSDPLCDC